MKVASAYRNVAVFPALFSGVRGVSADWLGGILFFSPYKILEEISRVCLVLLFVSLGKLLS